MSYRFAPYRCDAADVTRAEVFSRANRAMHGSYGPVCSGSPTGRPVAFPMFAYRELIASLARMPHIEPVSLAELCRKPAGDGRVRLAIRHDVDGDIVSALLMARIERELGVPTSYYFLHTAYYHGTFRHGVFRRHECVAHVYREIQGLGHEVGLHTDALSVYQRERTDGAEALATELAWMRSEGLDVTGTVAHGSKSVFGAENFEIFKGRRKGEARMPDFAADKPVEYEHDGAPARLRVLNEAELGLVYEGNDIFWQKDVPVEYGATRTVDGWRWNARPCQSDADHGAGPPAPEFRGQDVVLGDIAALQPGRCVVLVVHPCYYGARDRTEGTPVIRHRRVETAANRRLGWRTYAPRRPQCWSNDCGEPQDYQAVNWSNELGMLDAPLARGGDGERILLLGSGFLDGREVAVPSQVQSVLARMIKDSTHRDCLCVKLAFPGMGISRVFSWYKTLARRFRPTVVILGITTQELRHSVPALWSAEEGVSLHHPPGDYLGWRDGRIVEVRRSPGWRIRQRPVRTFERWPGTTTPIVQIMGASGECIVEEMDCWAYLRACYAHVAGRVRRDGARAVLFVAERGERAEWPDRGAGARFGDRVREIATAAGLPLVDAYEPFDPGDPPGDFYHGDRTWNEQFHRHAAACLYDHLTKEGVSPVRP